MNKVIVLMSVTVLLFSAAAQETPGGMASMSDSTMMLDMTSEADYIAHMIAHHQEAIDSATLFAVTTSRPELKDFAQRISSAQRSEVALMQGWFKDWYPDMPKATLYTPMMRDFVALDGDASDRMFLEDMIAHHRMAVGASDQLLENNLAEHEEVAELARAIVETQQSEILLMQAWLHNWYGVTGNKMDRNQ